MSYGVDLPNVFRQTAAYADRILKGANPADLPISLPTKFELVINLTTAKALGIDVPLSLMLRADRCSIEAANVGLWHLPAVATAAKDGRSRLESGRWRSAARWLPERELSEKAPGSG
jgi:hypothetical protein